ncbi:NAD(P)-dependent alcohol dehydrogenase [Bradyrhizobium sp.]|uniref:NAD(P)-dependent alcohol dehydrogenase n=1 Tax=Bradyrhizobium sp. TaxID=376 RepID=UPI00290C0A0A|nr:NAD(P)-dependent alcohol dehydrogenase [Bradyrhizobium sp.]MDU6488644.1 NAD(P)-dependent alcohol dehydrogenase [Bradyrhizobium sp.]
MKIKAAVLEDMGRAGPYAASRPLKILDVELDGPGPGEVLVRIAAAGLCHSDLSVINGDRPRPLPMVLGHEASGVVEEVGAGVDDLVRGDHVVCVFVPSCGHCAPCAQGRPALCEPGAEHNGKGDLLSGGFRLHRGEARVHHHCGVSCFAEYATMSRRSLVKVQKEVPLHIAALMGCAVLTGTGAVFNGGDVGPGGKAAIIGLGGVGLAAVMGAIAIGAETVVAIDMFEPKLALARELGATHTINPTRVDATEEITKITGYGVNFALDTTGMAAVIRGAVMSLAPMGTCGILGASAMGTEITLDEVHFMSGGRRLMGIVEGESVPEVFIPMLAELNAQGRFPFDRLVKFYSLDQINEAIHDSETGKTIKPIVRMS